MIRLYRSPLALLLVGLCLLCGGCPYSTRSGLPEHIRTVQVPVFKNSTMYKGLETKLTEELIARLLDDPNIRVVNGDGDAIITGEITSVDRNIQRETRADRPAAVQISVIVNYRFYDNVEQRALIDNESLSSSASSTIAGLIDVDRGEVQATAEDEAVRTLARDIARRTAGMW